MATPETEWSGYDNVSDKNTSVIVANQHVLIRLPSEGMRILQVKDSGIVSLGKFGSFEILNIIGYPYGQTFEIIGENGVKPIKSMTVQNEVDENEDEPLDKDLLTKMFSDSAENNQNIINIGSSVQTLTSEEVDKLKKSGASCDVGQRIIEQMIAGHAAFDKKTIYSQQKYLRRKQQKFLRRFTVDSLGPSQLLEYYILKDLQKVLDMSQETLGMMLTYANVRPGGRYLVVDETGGVLLYAMLERMQGQGTILTMHDNEHPNHIALRYSDYSQGLQDGIIKNLNWLQVLEPEQERIVWESLEPEAIEALKTTKKVQYFRREKRAKEINDTIDLFQAGNFDALITVSTLDMKTVMPHVIGKVGGSRPIVVYHQFKEVLLETQHFLQEDKRILAPSIFETRVREYQTIPGRMHPLMTSAGYGGYLLWCTRVIPSDNVTAVGRGIKRK